MCQCIVYTVRRVEWKPLLQKKSDWPWQTKIVAPGVCVEQSTDAALCLCLLMISCSSINSTSESLRSSVARHSIWHGASEEFKQRTLFSAPLQVKCELIHILGDTVDTTPTRNTRYCPESAWTYGLAGLNHPSHILLFHSGDGSIQILH